MAEVRCGLLDTSVVVFHDLIDTDALPEESAISAVTLAELAAGPHAASDAAERARRQDRLQWVAATWEIRGVGCARICNLQRAPRDSIQRKQPDSIEPPHS